MIGDLTEIQKFAIATLLRSLGERELITSLEDRMRYLELIPKNLKLVHRLINDELARCAMEEEPQQREFCRYKAGDNIIRFETYPPSISKETIRQALRNAGLRPSKKRNRAS